MIDSFQGHHKYPWTITKRDWQNNVQMVARPVTFPTALVALLPLSAPASLFWATFSTMVVYSQQFHAWCASVCFVCLSAVLLLVDLMAVMPSVALGVEFFGCTMTPYHSTIL